MEAIRKKIYEVIEVADPEHRGESWTFDIVLMTLIILNALAIILESVPEIKEAYIHEFYYFEVFSVIFFSLEYILRIWSVTVNPDFRHPVWGRMKFIFTPYAVIDLLAILPFYINIFGMDMRIVRVLRIFRIFRLFKLVRYARALRIINGVFKSKKEELIISLFFILFMLLIVSCVMYFVENAAQPDQFSSIPETMWWGVATLTTVGYGDVYPVTNLGRLLAGIIAILGVGLFALPTGILAAGCAEEIEKFKAENNKEDQEEEKLSDHCPCCGRPLQ